jgi:hypothetical protein
MLVSVLPREATKVPIGVRVWPFCDMATVADNGCFRLGSRHPCMI